MRDDELEKLETRLALRADRLPTLQPTPQPEVSAEDEARSAREAREAKGGLVRVKHRAGIQNFVGFFMTVCFKGDVATVSPSIVVRRGVDIPGKGTGDLVAAVHAQDNSGQATSSMDAERFVTKFNFVTEEAEEHVEDEIFGVAAEDQSLASGNVLLPRSLDWATAPDDVVDEQVKRMGQLFDQSHNTLTMLLMKAGDPELNPDIAMFVRRPEALQDTTSVVQ